MLDLPDWNHWGRLKTVSLRDALVLTIGLCPHKYNHENIESTELLYAHKYWDNLQIAKNHIYESDWVVGKIVKKDFDVDVSQTHVNLEKFCKWALQDVQLTELPTEMEILGGAQFSAAVLDNKAVEKLDLHPHSFKNQSTGLRRDILTAVFESAWTHLNFTKDWQPVWVRLCEMADKAHPPFVECVEDSIKYKDAGEIKFLTKDAVRGRVRRLLESKN